MENASKALIIAGAILLSILIISLGIMVYNNAKNTIGSANLDKQEIQAYNSEWLVYEGTRKGSEVKTMIQAAIAHNQIEANNKTDRFIKVDNTNESDWSTSNPNASIQTFLNSIVNTKMYTVTCNTKDGYVVFINVN